MATYNSGSYISTDNGKFRLEVEVTVSNAGMVCKPKLHISDAFKSSQTFELTYYANNKTLKTVKKAPNGTKKYKSSGTHVLTTFTIKDFKVSKAIKLKVNGKTASIAGGTIKSTLKPPTPSISVEQTKPTIWTITVTGKGEEEQPVNKVYLEYTNIKNAQDGDWHSLNFDSFGYHPSDSNTKPYTSVFKPEVDANQYYRFRARASGSKTGTEIFSAWVYSDGFVSRPEETSDVAIDTSTQTLTWTASLSDIDKKIVTGWYIYRAEANGEFSIVAEVEAEEGKAYYSWVDNSQVTGHSYRYKVVGYNDYGESWDTSETIVEIEGTPYPPSLTEVNYYYDSDGSVVINFELNDNIDEVFIERSNNGGTSWSIISTLQPPTSSYTDTAATSASIYRVRFRNEAGFSEYCESFQPAAKVAPSEPTILLPTGGAYIPIDEGTVRICWQHNPLDGAPQKSANIDVYDGDGVTILSQTITGDTNYLDWNVGSTSPSYIEIEISTQGENGLWSGTSLGSFFLVRRPQILITSPTGSQSTLPVSVNFTYTTSSVDVGTDIFQTSLEEVVVEVIDEGGETVFITNKTYNTDTSVITDSISLMDALFVADQDYTLQISGRESNGLTAKHLTNFNVTYTDEVLDGSLYPIVDNDEDTGYVMVHVSRDIGDDGQTEPAAITHAYLYRNANGERELLDEVYDGYEVIDMLAPVNKAFTYELLQLYEGGTAALVVVEAVNPCPYSFIYWGKNYKHIAVAQWNPTQSTNMSRPERTLVRYSGRKYPVVYDSKAREETSNFTADLEPEQLDAFIDVMNAGGIGIWKSVQGRTFKASFDFDFERIESKYQTELYKGTLKVTRVED